MSCHAARIGLTFFAFLALGCASPSSDSGGTDHATGVQDTADSEPEGTPTARTYRVDDAPEGTKVKAADLAIGEDGTLYAAFVDYRNGDKDTWVTRSTDGGVTWEASVRVDGDDIEAMAGGGQQVYLMIAGERLIVVLTAQSYEDKATVLLYESALGSTLEFSGPTPVGVIEDTSSVAYGKPALTPDGEIWIAWQAYEVSDSEVEGFLAYARESTDYAAELPSAQAGGIPCECCRLDLQFSAEGEAMLAFRNNIDNIRDEFVLIAEAGSSDFSESVEVSTTNPELLYCPSEGPRVAQRLDGEHLMAWSDSGRVHLSSSTDGGRTWSEEALLVTDQTAVLEGEADPTLVVDDQGRTWLSIESDEGSVLLRSETGELSFTEQIRPEGTAGFFGQPTTVKSEAGLTAILGVVDESSVWIHLPE